MKHSFFNRKIAIFVAGSTSLKAERDALKSVILDLNKTYHIHKWGIDIDIKSYNDDFLNLQNEYDKYVQETADIMFVVVTDSIGEKTEKELEKASVPFLKKRRPVIDVFIKNDDVLNDDDPRVVKVRKYLSQDFYAIKYKDLDELKIEAKRCIMRKIGILYRVIHDINTWARRFSLLTLLVIVGFFGWNLYSEKNCDVKERPTILFAGGGSAANFILQHTGIDIYNYDGSVYANMPSGNAWALLSEEYYRFVRAGRPDSGPSFVTLCVSADKADMKVLLKTCARETFQTEASIIECLLGYDTLAVYIERNFFNKMKMEGVLNDSTQISPKQVAELIHKHETANVFVTSAESGTTRIYQDCVYADSTICIDSMLKNSLLTVYNEASDISDFMLKNSSISNWKPFVVLGSTSYFVNILEKEQRKGSPFYYTMLVKKDNTSFVTKPIYLYFVAFKDLHDKNKVVISKPIWDFMNTDGMSNLVGKKCVEQIKSRRITNGGLVSHLKSKVFLEEKPIVNREQ